ncbi:hypothetical protein V5799_033794 [Amblyomma americanum]|uniref:Serine/threonine-protein kinase 40 n=1 Tax=Amblyomma americanum TaxID=6943 RepID=A0AAQ4DMA8_AMBAM
MRETPEGLVYTGRQQQRLCLVLDCLCRHDFGTDTADLVNLQHYVIREKRLQEREALFIFQDIVRIVSALHRLNIVHRDLKLGNMVFDKRKRKVTITNFCLGKHLINENDLLKDQRGSPAYISPDVLSGKPYLGKPSDMWALGVVLFTMLYGQFPFYDSNPQELFRKIKAAEFTLPNHARDEETATTKRPEHHGSAAASSASSELTELQHPLRGNVGDLIFSARLGIGYVPDARKPVVVGAAPKRRQPGVLPIQRVHEDARPLTAIESMHYHNILRHSSSSSS